MPEMTQPEAIIGNRGNPPKGTCLDCGVRLTAPVLVCPHCWQIRLDLHGNNVLHRLTEDAQLRFPGVDFSAQKRSTRTK